MSVAERSPHSSARAAIRCARPSARRSSTASRDHPNVVVLDADIAGGTGVHHFRKAHPDRFFQFGIAEQNMMAAAGGMAATGLHPGRHDLRRVLPARHRTGAPLDRLRQAQREDRREPSRPRRRPRRRLGASARRSRRLPRHPRHDGDLAGRSGRDGASDHAPSSISTAPSTCAPAAAPRRASSADDHKFEIGKGQILRDGSDVTIVACGVEVARALEAAELLANATASRPASSTCRRSSRSTPRCSPLRRGNRLHRHRRRPQHLRRPRRRRRRSARADACPARSSSSALRDHFGQSGEPQELAEHYGLTAPHIAEPHAAPSRRKRTQTAPHERALDRPHRLRHRRQPRHRQRHRPQLARRGRRVAFTYRETRAEARDRARDRREGDRRRSPSKWK